MNSVKILKFLILSLFLGTNTALATTFTTNKCSALFSNPFPSLNPVLRDPDLFFLKMTERYEQQKNITPDNPHLFNYSEIGLPALKWMNQSAISQLSAIRIHQHMLKSKSVDHLVKIKKEDLDIAEIWLKDLLAEIDSYIQNRKVSYYDTLRLSNYYSRAISHFHDMLHPAWKKTMLNYDRYLEGYKPLSTKEEYELYKKNGFFIFPVEKKSGIKGYRDAQAVFEDSVLNKNKIKSILIPTYEVLDSEVISSLLTRDNIHLVGLSRVSIQADGFLRPPADFWYHDLRHESAKRYEKHIYMQENSIPESRNKDLITLMDKWHSELIKETEQITDNDLKEAVKLMTFNFHHDSGYPLAPSSFLKKFNIGKMIAFYSSLVLGGENPKFKNPTINIKNAEKFLRNFWTERLSQEAQFLHNTN